MTIDFQNGKFVIENKDVFLFGGEFHYFRIPKNEWASRLDQLVEAGCNLVSTYVPWIWHEPVEGCYDFIGQTRPEKDLRSFLSLVREKGLYCIVRPGPYVMAETHNAGMPEWLLRNYPDLLARTKENEVHPSRMASYLHPKYLEKVREWYFNVNKIISPMQIDRDGTVIMYQLCNEVGMFHWVSGKSDLSADVRYHLEKYLKHKFKSIEPLNEVYEIHALSFSEFIETFLGGDESVFYYEWRNFWRSYYKEYIGLLRDFAKKDGIDVPFIVNIHGFKDFSTCSRGIDYPIGLSQLCRTAEFPDVVMAGDFYPGHIGYDHYHDLVLACTMTKAISSESQPLFSAEFQSGRLADRPRLYPQDLDLNTRTCVAQGMNALNYYMFIGGENYEDIGIFGRRHEWQAPIDSLGQRRPNYNAAKQLGLMFQIIGPRLVNAKKVVQTYVSFNPDDYLTDVMEFADKSWQNLAGQRVRLYFDGILRLLVTANIPFEAVDVTKPFSVKDIPSLWMFATDNMQPNIQRRLVDYVKNGGKLILYPRIPTHDLEGNACTILSKELNLGEWDLVDQGTALDVLDYSSVWTDEHLEFKNFTGDIIAKKKSGTDYAVSAYYKSIGIGQVLVMGFGMNHRFDYQSAVIRDIAMQIGISNKLTTDHPNLYISERKNGDESYIFLTNYDEQSITATVFEDGIPLFNGHTVTLPSRSGLLCLRNFEIAPGLVINYATVELLNLTREDNYVSMTLRPNGTNGSFKLLLDNRWWDMGSEQKVQNGYLEMSDISEEKTLVFFKRVV